MHIRSCKRARAAFCGSLLFVVSLTACQTDGAPAAAGVSAALWSIDSAPAVEIGASAASAGDALYRVVGAVQRADGSVVVANAGASDVRVYAATRELISRSGQSGDGPGDYRFMSGLARCGGDSLAVLQPGRVTILSPSGVLARVVAPPEVQGGPAAEPVSVGPDRCDQIVWLSRKAMPFDTSGYLEQAYELIARDGETQRTVTSFAGTVRYRTEVDGEPAMIRLPFWPEPAWDASNGTVFFTSGANDSISFWDASGKMEAVRWDATRPVISPEEKARYVAARLALIQEEPRYARSLLPWEQLPSAPTVRPSVSKILADGEQHVWLRPYPSRSDGIGGETDVGPGGVETWTIVHVSEGTQSQIKIPAAFAITEIGDAHITGVWTDDDGVESVRVYRLNRR